LLQSVLHGTPQARFDILFACPGEALTLTTAGLESPSGIAAASFTDALDRWWQSQRLTMEDDSGLPFRGGWLLFLGYELAGEIEPCLDLPPDPDGLPVALALRIPGALVHDHARDTTYIVGEPGETGLVHTIRSDLGALQTRPPAPLRDNPPDIDLAEAAPVEYLQGVEHIKRYIREGDVFQVNLSRRWTGELEAGYEDAALYARLCRSNPAPFAGLWRHEDFAILSSSPERLVAVRNRIASTRPIAGTRRRGGDECEDAALTQELTAHPKECAEHVMLIDLERNDLGRVSQPGTVDVDELMIVERYAHVQHIVSNVSGRLRDDVTPGQVIRALFPGGTITGCPKVRCMEIIAELEGEGRGAYTGSLGYLNRNGDMDLNILIRTFVRHGNRLSLRTGAGIVADSDPEAELQETRHKAEGLLRALA
jgi:anthranilate synthase component 1